MQPESDVGADEQTGSGIFLWFDWEEISRNEHHQYGKFVYEKLLPLFRIKVYDKNDLVMPGGRYSFYDGDAIPQEEFGLQAQDHEEADVLDQAKLSNYSSMYVVAIYAWQLVDFSRLERKIRNSLGYIGKTTFKNINYKEFYQLTGQLALPNTFELNYDILEKECFDFFTDDQLREMGFFVTQSRYRQI